MPLTPIGEIFDEGWAAIGAGAIGCPLHGRVDRKGIVTVHPKASDTIADGARGECRPLAACKAREGRYRPLVVDDLKNDWRIIHSRKCQRAVEVALGLRSVTTPDR